MASRASGLVAAFALLAASVGATARAQTDPVGATATSGSNTTAAAGGSSSDETLPSAGTAEAAPRVNDESAPEEAQNKPEATFVIRALGLEESPVKIFGWIQNS